MEQLDDHHVLVNNHNGIMHLTLNRPESLNAFSPEMIRGLRNAIKQAKQDDQIRVVIISGSGRAFCAGGDVKHMGQRDALATYKHLGETNELMLSMKDLDKPIIAAVHGFAAGAGFNLALACDIILAAKDSKFVLSFSKVGLVSDGGGHFFLTRLIGPYRAKELLFSAEPIQVEKAHVLGFVNHIYSTDEFEGKVRDFAEKLAAGPATAYGFIKKIADQSLVSSLDEILEQERITQATLVSTADHQEGIRAFKEKREPNFRKGLNV